MNPNDEQRKRDRYVAFYIAIVTVLAVFTTGILVKVEMVDQSASVNWIAFGLFATLLIGVVILVGALTFIPALALGPIVEHLTMVAAK